MRSLFVGALTLMSLASTAASQPTAISLGTATPGGGFPVYGAAFAETVNAMDPTLSVQPRNTKGSAENIPLLEKGELDIGLVQGEAVHEAFAGIGRPPANLLIIAAMYSSPGMFVVRADSPYRSIADLRGKPVAMGAKGSGLVILGRYVIDGIGLDVERDFQPVYLDRAGDGPAMVLDGRVAALWGGGIGWPGFVTMSKSPGGARFIPPDAGEIDRILAKHTFLRRIAVPANTYAGQTAPIESVGSWSFVLARPTLPDDVAYRLAKALHKGEKMIAEKLPQANETTAANTVAGAPRAALIHPGAMRYFRETGLAK
jgi:TRAP transporter TAXI family solute receptor